MNDALSWYMAALGSMFDVTASLVYDQGVDGTPGFIPGYGALLDPTLCAPENLPYLGQFIGVQIPVGTDPVTALSLVTAEAGLNRGTIASIVAAIQRNLVPGAPPPLIQERLGPDGSTADAYWLIINVAPSNVVSLAAMEAAINSVIPGGVFYTIIESTSPTYSVATLEYENVASTVLYANVASGQV